MILASAAIAIAALAPAVNVADDDTPPDPIYVEDIARFALAGGDDGGPACQGYWELRLSLPEWATTTTDSGFSMVDSFAIVAYEVLDGGRMTDAARDFYVTWLHTC